MLPRKDRAQVSFLNTLGPPRLTSKTLRQCLYRKGLRPLLRKQIPALELQPCPNSMTYITSSYTDFVLKVTTDLSCDFSFKAGLTFTLQEEHW